MQSNAYVSGMKEDLKLYGNELNYFTTFFKSVSAGLLNARHADSVQYRLHDHALPFMHCHIALWPFQVAANM